MATTRSARFQERIKLLLNAPKKEAPVSLAVSEPARRCFGSLWRFASHQPNRSVLNAGGRIERRTGSQPGPLEASPICARRHSKPRSKGCREMSMTGETAGGGDIDERD